MARVDSAGHRFHSVGNRSWNVAIAVKANMHAFTCIVFINTQTNEPHMHSDKYSRALTVRNTAQRAADARHKLPVARSRISAQREATGIAAVPAHARTESFRRMQRLRAIFASDA